MARKPNIPGAGWLPKSASDRSTLPKGSLGKAPHDILPEFVDIGDGGSQAGSGMLPPRPIAKVPVDKFSDPRIRE